MKQDGQLIDFAAERERRVHEQNDKRLLEMRKAFEKALPLPGRKKARKKKKKR